MHEQERRRIGLQVDAVVADPHKHSSVLFQSVFDFATGEYVGGEALARFAFGRQTVRPDLFINDAHAIGRGVEVEMAVLHRAYDSATDLADRLALGRPLHVSFNVTGVTAQTDEFLAFLGDVPSRDYRGRSVDAVFEIVESHMPAINTRDVGMVIDMPTLAQTVRTIISNGHPYWLDDLLDDPEEGSPLLRGTTIHTPAALATSGARPSAIKLSYGLLRGLGDRATPEQRTQALAVLDRAAILSTVNSDLSDPFGQPLVTVLEGMSTPGVARLARDRLREVDAQGVFYGQGTCLGGAMSVDIGDDHLSLGPDSLKAPGGLLLVDRSLGFPSSLSPAFGPEMNLN